MRNAHQWIDQILKELFAPDHRRLVAWVDKLCENNQEIVGKDVHGFIYAGAFYRPSNVRGVITGRKSLHSSLAPKMEDFLRSKQIMEVEKTKLRQALFMLLEPCNDQQDIRDTLPECIVDCLPELRQHYPNRKKAVAFTIASNERAMKTFNRLLPKMEEYSVARMIF